MLVLCGLAFGILATNVVRDAYFDWDINLMQAIQANRPPWMDTLAYAVGWVGFPPQSNFVIGGLVVLLFVLGLRWEAVCTAIAAVATGGIWFQITPFINRPRPSDDLVPIGSSIPLGSFPSGHVMILTAVFGFAAWVAFVHARRGWLRTLLVGAVVLYLAVLGFVRMYAGDHWPSDVLGGYLIGGVFLSMTILLHLWLTRRKRTSE